ncbi:hypothetical protein OZX69_09720 (plasmid) [Lactobacillus sp. ESL0731]|uniref:hypothetical protein n=1 Tax=unclassified Lactobacillus TaxID=2620435 RepID=UPI0023F91201|nr:MULTISPECIES: hypothetical protein [unclassified Lactobacillus]WEV52079.1 hypothetical protein OZX63_09605 [Lactobacillus sp. ESL0700]WEV63230.1 hypothetical protein OZX69_09720 [Lactobacillus sp. ESL0731]
MVKPYQYGIKYSVHHDFIDWNKQYRITVDTRLASVAGKDMFISDLTSQKENSSDKRTAIDLENIAATYPNLVSCLLNHGLVDFDIMHSLPLIEVTWLNTGNRSCLKQEIITDHGLKFTVYNTPRATISTYQEHRKRDNFPWSLILNGHCWEVDPLEVVEIRMAE